MSDPDAQLQACREEIDRLDQVLLECLAARFEVSERIASVKAVIQETVYQPGRASQVAARFQRIGGDLGIHPRFLEQLYGLVHAESCRRQQLFLASRSWRQIGYLGPAGTFSEDAAVSLQRRLGLTAQLIPFASIQNVVNSVADNAVDAAVIPVENRLCGAVQQTVSALQAACALYAWDEWWLPVAQCLLANDGTHLANIHEVWSAAPALDQCARWIAGRNLRMRVFDSTARAGEALHESGRTDAAAIGSPRMADITGLVVLRDGIADEANNATRFAVIAHKPDLLT